MSIRVFGILAQLTFFAPALFSVAYLLTPQPLLADSNEFAEHSIEELMEVDVYSVSRKASPLQDSAAAVYVLRSEDIRRIGARSVPEALRVVPGLQVARVNSHTWAISARGFNSNFSNKLLVLVDGRSVYTPGFAGVYWDVQQFDITSIDRIEVIRGPGATLWGANAVNGIINIITKNSKDTKGLLLSAGAGNVERGFGTIRWGGSLGDNWNFRASVNERSIDDHETGNDLDAQDEWNHLRGSFRVDGELSPDDTLMIQGGVYVLDSGETYVGSSVTAPPPDFTSETRDDIEDTGFHILSRWDSQRSEDSRTGLQLYFDRTDREQGGAEIATNTVDLDFQHSINLTQSFDVMYGLGWRLIDDKISLVPGTSLQALRPERTLHYFSGFLQGDWHVLPEEFTVTVGSKFEHNDYTGDEIQPNARALWKVNRNHSVWASVARAVRTPSRVDNDIIFDSGLVATAPNGLPIFNSFRGDTGIESENLLALEAGYRGKLSNRISFDIATFLNHYDDLMTVGSPGMPSTELDPFPRLVVPTLLTNGGEADSWGVEAAVIVQVFQWARMHLGYTYFDLDVSIPDSHVVYLSEPEGDPRNQFNLRAHLDLTPTVELDTILYFVDDIVTNEGPVNDYTRVDFRVGWQATDSVELSAVLQNAFEDRHREFTDQGLTGLSTNLERTFFGQVVWNYDVQ